MLFKIRNFIVCGGKGPTGPPSTGVVLLPSEHHKWKTYQVKSGGVEEHVVRRKDPAAQSMARSCVRGVSRHHVLAVLATLALALGGLVQQSTTVALLSLSDPLNSAEFAQYVANTSYLTSNCSGQVESKKWSDEDENTKTSVGNHTDEEFDDLDFVANKTSMSAFLLSLKVPLLEEDRAAAILRVAFLWGALVSPLFGWQLTRRAGAKRVLGYGALAAGSLSLLVPAAWGTVSHIILRVVQGAATGVMWPALQTLAATWCPQEQRSLFVSAYAAWSLGCGLANLIGPGLVRSLGRDALFYVEAAITCAWFAAWSLLVANTPASANKDKWYVAFQPRQGTVQAHSPPSRIQVPMPERPAPAPWRHILTSGPVWGAAIAVLGGQWGQSTLRLAAPRYLQLVYGFTITQDPILTALPQLGHFLSALACGLIADHVIANRIASKTTTRKIFVYAAHFVPAALLFVAGYTGCDPTAPAAMFCAAALFSGALPAGAFASALEIAPNYAGAVFALCHTAGAAGGLAANYVITEGLHGSLPGSWRLVFGAASLALLGSACCFLVLGSGTEQSWNRPPLGTDSQHQDEEGGEEAQEEHDIDDDRETATQDQPTLHPSATQMTFIAVD